MTVRAPSAVVYDPRRPALYRPGEADDFFRHPGTASGAALLAELSRLSYCDDVAVRRRSLALVGLDEQEFLDVEGTPVLVATATSRLIIAFRGRDDPKAFVQDLDVLPTPWENGGPYSSETGNSSSFPSGSST